MGGILNKPGGLGRWSTLFNSVIESLELVELDICNRMYTWSNDHADPLFQKLDKCLVNLDWAELFPLITVSALERGLSDHCPLIIDFGSIDRGGKPFKFELCWFFRDDLELIVREVWAIDVLGLNSLDEWQFRLMTLRKRLKGWNRNVEGR